MLIIFHVLLILLSIRLLIKSYINNPQTVIINSFSYLLFYSILYLSIPSILIDYKKFSPLIGEVGDEIEYTSFISLYIVSIFLIAFYISLKVKKRIVNSSTHLIMNKNIYRLINILLLIITLYIIGVLIYNYDTLIQIYGNRRLQADFNSVLINQYKIYGLFNILIILICLIYLFSSKYKYLLFFLPFVFIDILLSSRYLILCSIVVSIILLSYKLVYFKISNILFLLLGLIFMGIIRSTSFENIDLSSGLLEFLFTYSSAFLILDSAYQSNILEVLAHSFGKIFLINPYEILTNTEYIDYKLAMSNLNPFSERMGLGGSFLTEVLSFKNIFVIILIPLYLVFYGFVINYFLKSNLLWLRIYGILFIVFTFSFFRGSLFDHLFYPLQLMFYFGTFILILDIVSIKKTRNKYE